MRSQTEAHQFPSGPTQSENAWFMTVWSFCYLAARWVNHWTKFDLSAYLDKINKLISIQTPWKMDPKPRRPDSRRKEKNGELLPSVKTSRSNSVLGVIKRWKLYPYKFTINCYLFFTAEVWPKVKCDYISTAPLALEKGSRAGVTAARSVSRQNLVAAYK